MALLGPPRSETPSATATVATLVIVHAGLSLPEALEAVGRQVYEPESVVVVGGGSRARDMSGSHGWVETLAEALADLDDAVTHVWLLHDDSIPRPDALEALVRESVRSESEVVGSKILRAGHHGVLESVGLATDVFEVPVTGLDSGELDQEQYDVLRDVAFVSGSSILIGRGLLEQLGGMDPRLEHSSAALDLCQRARLAGARVMVVPSAEVLHDGTCTTRVPRWRSEAGRLRMMLKSYSWMSLAWVVPLNFVLGLLEALVAPLIGRWRLWVFIRSWAWNLVRLPETLRLRRQVKRAVGDEELFRYQVRGSVRVSSFFQAIGARFVALSTSRRLRTVGHLVETGQETVRRPVVAALFGGVGFALFLSRQFWSDGVAAVGYALPLPASAGATLRSFAGGWNPADLGSPAPLRPLLGLMALAQSALLGKASLAMTVVMVVAFVAGVVGTARLLGPFGVRPLARYAAGVLLVAGPGARVLAGDGMWHGLVAMSVLPWILATCLHRRGTVAAVATAGLLTALAAAFLPLMLLVPTVLLGLWALIAGGKSGVGVGRSALAGLVAVPALLPWIGALDDIRFFVESGPDAFWSPSPWALVLVAVAFVTATMAGSRLLAGLAGWGAISIVAGAILARSGSFGWGSDPGATGLAVVGLGVAMLAGAALELGAEAFASLGWRRYSSLIASVAASVLLLGTITLAIPGRAGFAAAGFDEAIGFAAEDQPGRILIVGDEAEIPGGGRPITGAVSYRVFSTPQPRLWEAWPSPARAGDKALADVLAATLDGSTFRLGTELEPFGVRWILAIEAGPVSEALDAQLDLFPLGLADVKAYKVEVDSQRAVDTVGGVWAWEGPDYVGPAGPRSVRIAENGDTRWGDSSQAAGWANLVTTDSGRIRFGPIGSLQAAAWVALGWSVLLIVGAVLGRLRSRS